MPINWGAKGGIGSHHHLKSQIIDETTDQVADLGAGGATPTLAEVLAEGADTGETALSTPIGATIDGTTGNGEFDIYGPEDANNRGGDLTITPSDGMLAGGPGKAGHDGGPGSLKGGTAASAPSAYAALIVAAGAKNDGTGGGGSIAGGAAGSGSGADGGDVTLTPGAGDGAGRHGLVFLNLPTSDPGVAGALWADTLVVKVSAG